jgi:hypothetical protein
MKIKGIEESKSVRRGVFIQTDPPVTREVFVKFQELWHVKELDLSEDGKLIWHGTALPDREFIKQTDLYLSEAENKLAQEKSALESDRKEFLRKFSDSTGVPLI